MDGAWLNRMRRLSREDRKPALQQVDANLAIGVEHGEGRARIVLAGELDLGNASAFRSQLRREEEGRPELVEVDLRGLTFIDSSGLGELFAANRRARERGARLLVIENHGPIERTLNLARIEDVMDVVVEPV